jgi:hypothetical protein
VEVYDYPSGHVTLWASPGSEPGEISLQVRIQAADYEKAELAFRMQFGGTIEWE